MSLVQTLVMVMIAVGATLAGRLNITTTDESTRWRGYNPYKRKYETLEKFYRSSMLTTWNKFCFTGEWVSE